jgi:hypothetical protein
MVQEQANEQQEFNEASRFQLTCDPWVWLFSMGWPYGEKFSPSQWLMPCSTISAIQRE